MDQIQLEKSKLKLDFSNGSEFYLTTDYSYAVTYGKNTRTDVAVVIFDMTEPLQFQEMDLSEREEEWKMVVTYNGSGYDPCFSKQFKKNFKTVLEEFSNCDYVTGPISSDCNKFLQRKKEPSGFLKAKRADLC